jgi:hypothetical protein
MIKKLSTLMLCFAILGFAEQSTNETTISNEMADIVI